MTKRKICFVITSAIHYSRSKFLLDTFSKNKNLELQIAVAASAILPQYGNVLDTIVKDGFRVSAKIIMTLSGGSPVSMAKTTGIGLTEFATAFDNLKPDIVVLRGDRYEVLSAAIAASYMNISIAHIEGGDVTGTIDESVRHAVTKLSHIHFTTNDDSYRRVIQMGENPENVFNVGCIELEHLSEHNEDIKNEEINRKGVGENIDLANPFLLVLFHPVTTEQNNKEHTNNILRILHKMSIPTIWFWPNVDAGTSDVSKAIRVFRENVNPENMHFLIYLQGDKFISLLKKASCLVGNSSAGIKECSHLGIPVVNIGSRQNGRLRANNVIDIDSACNNLKSTIEYQLDHGSYKPSDIYFKKGSSLEITNILAHIGLSPQKKFHE